MKIFLLITCCCISILLILILSRSEEVTYKSDCIFCDIAQKSQKSHIVWETSSHLAFLSIYPNMHGVTVVIPKQHRSSYVFDLEDKELKDLVVAAKQVAKILDMKLEGVGRTAMVFEGFGVDHVHAKLYPLPGTSKFSKQWQQIKSNNNTYFTQYSGYICSNDSHRAKENELECLAKTLREEATKIESKKQ
jgi:diadenosine tetraphosphate (Ap4A) HIT family hydrolase